MGLGQGGVELGGSEDYPSRHHTTNHSFMLEAARRKPLVLSSLEKELAGAIKLDRKCTKRIRFKLKVSFILCFGLLS